MKLYIHFGFISFFVFLWTCLFCSFLAGSFPFILCDVFKKILVSLYHCICYKYFWQFVMYFYFVMLFEHTEVLYFMYLNIVSCPFWFLTILSCLERSFLPSAAAAKSLQSCPTLRPRRQQPTRLLCPWDSPGKNAGVGCHFLLQCMKEKSES